MPKTKRYLLICAMAAVLPHAILNVHAAAIAADTTATLMRDSTPIDWVIDLAVSQRAATGNLTTRERLVAREQMQIQFRALPADKQRQIIAATNNMTGEESIQRVTGALTAAVRADAEAALASSRVAAPTGDQNSGSRTKLGLSGSDLVFVPTVGPCRVADTRFGINSAWPGPIAAFGARQIWGFASSNGYDYSGFQGGTGIAGSGNCAGTEFLGGGTDPVSVVITLTVVDTGATGALRAWDGSPALTVGSVLAWNAGDRMANTTVVPMDRGAAQYPGSGPYKRDFAVYNNSGGTINVVADVVGYFIRNEATALQCQVINGTNAVLASGTSQLIFAPSCPTGYTAMTARPGTGVFGVYTGTLFASSCRISNTTGAPVNVSCDAFCCRLPGR